MAASPSALAAGGTGWQFDFPGTDGHVNYLTTPATLAGGRAIRFTAQTQGTSGDPVFDWHTEAFNTGEAPATVRAYLQRANINWGRPSHRYWSNPLAFQLNTGGPTTVTTPLDPTQWSNVIGQTGTQDAAGWADLIAHVGRVGLTFGGGFFFGHGVRVLNGTATFVLTNFAVVP